MLEDRISKVKTLLEERERIDRELAVVFGLTEQPKRGLPKRDNREPIENRSTGWSVTLGESHSETTIPPDVDGLDDGASSK
jgi:hypothetical protein